MAGSVAAVLSQSAAPVTCRGGDTVFWDFDDWDIDPEEFAFYAGLWGLVEEEEEEEERLVLELEEDLDLDADSYT